MTWNCPAIDNAITFFPNGKVGPCCLIGSEYLKDASVIKDKNRFDDLKTETPPNACRQCINAENSGMHSYRDMFKNMCLDTSKDTIQYLDIRNTNICNLKCRYCGPHFSSKWSKELGIVPIIKEASLPKDSVITEDLRKIYFTGGEPLLNQDHWDLLIELVDKGLSKNIELAYNSNLMIVEFKQYKVFDIWSEFKGVELKGSIDAVGKPLEYIRSGSKWSTIEKNIQKILTIPNIDFKLTPVISILNIWWIDELYAYAQKNNIQIDPIILYGPDYLAINVIPDEIKDQALDILNKIENVDDKIILAKDLVQNNDSQGLFKHTLSHILYLDKIRDENLFELLPFDQVTKDLVVKNYEYE